MFAGVNLWPRDWPSSSSPFSPREKGVSKIYRGQTYLRSQSPSPRGEGFRVRAQSSVPNIHFHHFGLHLTSISKLPSAEPCAKTGNPVDPAILIPNFSVISSTSAPATPLNAPRA